MVNGVSKDKLRGGYYTPPEITEFLAKWAIKGKGDNVLEFSFGNGNFLVSIVNRLIELKANKKDIGRKIYGTELIEEEYATGKNRISEILGAKTDLPNLFQGDFFSVYMKLFRHEKFNAIVGNPPFIRYQHFQESHRELAFKIMQEVGLNPTRLTNAWVPFILASSLLLNNNGRIALVIPAEILQVKYASELRQFLSEYFNAITIISFDKLVFSGIQQEVILFLGEKSNDINHGINLVQLENEKSLKDYIHCLPDKKDCKPIDHYQDKWTQYYLTTEEILLLRRLRNDKRFTKLGDIAEIDVGIVTGCNDFFVVNKEERREYQLDKITKNLVGRTSQIQGIIFNKSDWENNDTGTLNTHLFTIPKNYNKQLPNRTKKYISLGESLNYHKGYKCSIRSPWYYVPSVWVSDAFLFRQIYDCPRMVLNKANAVTTDTIHRVKFKDRKKKEKIVGSFHNSLTFAFAEVMGRSYGGGVLELEPSEAEDLPIPYCDISDELVDEIDSLLRENNNMESVLSVVDELILKKKMNLTSREISILRGIWKKLSTKRIGRK